MALPSYLATNRNFVSYSTVFLCDLTEYNTRFSDDRHNVLLRGLIELHTDVVSF